MRQYNNENIKNNYKQCRTKQTVSHVLKMRDKYLKFDQKANVWDLMEKLDFVDASDPDLSIANLHHLYQTAEGIRRSGYPEWMQITGLIHDLGKILYLKGCDDDGTSINQQWSIVGDTFIVGCEIPDKCVYPEFNKDNPDMSNPKYNTKYGMYAPYCGLDECLVSFGHDEYLYHTLKHNKCTLPDEALYIIRYHSLYPYHDQGEYTYLMSEKDKDNIKYLKTFNKFDLYTKKNTEMDIENLKPYYKQVLSKYLSEELEW